MNIEKAIEILHGLVRHGGWLNSEDNVDAMKLGIEALKYIVDQRAEWLKTVFEPLPGETEE